MSELKCLSDQDLQKWYKNGVLSDDVIIIDVREPGEYKREHIPGSRNVPVSRLKSADFSADKNKIAIFHCHSGNRTKLARDVILSLNFKDTYCLPGGLAQWVRCNMPVNRNKDAPIDIMRQVQITIGILILTGVLLSWLISPYFILLCAFMGVGLVYAGVSGSCGMATLLSYMPWNKT